MESIDRSVPSSGKASVDRRTLVKGAPWSLPVIAITTAVPAHAASPVAANLMAEASNCDLLTVNILSGNQPGFTYTATQGTVPTGTQITLSSGGTAAISAGNFVFEGATVALVSLGGDVATFATLTDLAEGQSFTIGLTGLTVNVLGTYTTRVVTPDAVQDDDIAIMTAGGVGIGAGVGAFVCFDPDGGHQIPLPDLKMNVVIDYGWCSQIGLSLNNRPSFQIRVQGGAIPAGTSFVLYSTAALNVATGSWTAGGQALNLDLLGTGTQAAEFKTPRTISSTTPLTVQFQGAINLNLNSTYYLAYLGNDNAPADNARGMTITGVSLGLLTVASCRQIVA